MVHILTEILLNRRRDISIMIRNLVAVIISNSGWKWLMHKLYEVR